VTGDNGSLDASVLDIDAAKVVEHACSRLREILSRELSRRGLVVAISGGIDSSVCAALAVKALGPDKVFGLLLPERDSSGFSTDRGRQLAAHLQRRRQRRATPLVVVHDHGARRVHLPLRGFPGNAADLTTP